MHSALRRKVLLRAVLGLMVGTVLSGCATSTYSEYTPVIYNQARYMQDVKFCTDVTNAMRPSLSVPAIGAQAAGAAVSNAVAAAISPIAIALAAAAAGVREALSEMGVMSSVPQQHFTNCLTRKTDRDRSAFVAG